jgi:hypothetical protein
MCNQVFFSDRCFHSDVVFSSKISDGVDIDGISMIGKKVGITSCGDNILSLSGHTLWFQPCQWKLMPEAIIVD